MMSNKLSTIKPYTRAILKGHLCSCGFSYNQFDKPIIAVENSWNEIVPGHVHLREVAEYVKEGIQEAGGLALEFNTIAVSNESILSKCRCMSVPRHSEYDARII